MAADFLDANDLDLLHRPVDAVNDFPISEAFCVMRCAPAARELGVWRLVWEGGEMGEVSHH